MKNSRSRKRDPTQYNTSKLTQQKATRGSALAPRHSTWKQKSECRKSCLNSGFTLSLYVHESLPRAEYFIVREALVWIQCRSKKQDDNQGAHLQLGNKMQFTFCAFSVCLSLCLSLSVCLSASLSVTVSVSLSVSFCLCLSMCLSLSVSLSQPLSVCLSLSLSLCLSLPACFSVSCETPAKSGLYCMMFMPYWVH